VRRSEIERIEAIVACVISGDESMPVLIRLRRARIDVSQIPNDNGYRQLAGTLRERVVDAFAQPYQAGPGPADFEREVYGELGRQIR
jgi:CTP:molybdopterin cytidylyltransferase MocA